MDKEFVIKVADERDTLGRTAQRNWVERETVGFPAAQ